MTKRQELEAKAEDNAKKIKALKKENIEIGKELFLLCDETQWFTEKMETTTQPGVGRGARKVKVDRLIGRIHWKEEFKDDDTGEVVSIERSQVVRVDNNWEW